MAPRIRMWAKRKETARSQRMPPVHSAALPVNSQINSALFGKLPSEIRILIYRQVLLDFGDSQHICLDEGKQMKHIRCVGERSSGISRDIQRYWGPWGIYHSWCQRLSEQDHCTVTHGSSMVALLQTCRAVYSELIDMLYSSTAFNLMGNETIGRFIATTLRSRLDCIKVLHFSWVLDTPCYLTDAQIEWYGNKFNCRSTESTWENIWRVISCMTSLEELKVTIYASDFQVSEKKLLAPLFAVHADTFVVDLMWRTDFDTVATNAPFQIMPLTDGAEATVAMHVHIYRPPSHWFWRFFCFPFNR